MTYIICPHCEKVIKKHGRTYTKAPDSKKAWIKRVKEED